MASNKCVLCDSALETGFLDKLEGTVIKQKNGSSLDLLYVCSVCQKEHGDSLKDVVLKKK